MVALAPGAGQHGHVTDGEDPMTWQCSACDTINDHNAQTCSVCDAPPVSPAAPRGSLSRAATIVEAPPERPVARTAPLPRPGRRRPVARWIAFAILALTVVVVAASVNGGGKSTHDGGGGASGSGSSGSSGGTRLRGLTLRRRTYDRFSVDVPASWAIVARDVDHGAYIETEWRSPVSGTVFAKVDYTPGFSGTPRSGAGSVRGLYTGLGAYHEFGYAAYDAGGKDGWRWSFQYKGARKVDYFFTSCGTGFAFLGAAPPNRFKRLEPVYEHMVRSLKLAC